MTSYLIDRLSKLQYVNNYFSGIATIFMLHRVSAFEKNKLPPNENMKVSSEFLEKFITDLKSQGYEFISLDILHEILQKGKDVEKQIVFTLDDGYLDNYTHAYPIFKKHNVPFTIYITTSFPEKSAILWWYILEDLIVENKEILLSNGEKYSCKTYEDKIKTFMAIREKIITFSQTHFLAQLNELFLDYKIDWFSKNKELCLNWEHIIELSKDELCTIAGHTKNHYSLNQLSIDEIKFEIIGANRMIEEKIGTKIEHFAYPFGSKREINRREFNLVKSLGFKTTTTTRTGNIYFEHKNHLECLPRIMLTENFDIRNIGRIRKTRVVTI
ncbi:polysaccharide deacetylase family protein [uncultured Sulfuricurvum sp.]|uniref:polysaccharide deacetylase family protein n=1 Tax=uncultured Sulfuricurvum sp. TaxID=430693 RepID=UPI002606835F|nr:polysaccharide deacetylase family protein [uncultured Sulfuricurvum sp.]